MSHSSHKPIHPQNIPKHVGIILDGNGRWASSRNQPRLYGHTKGAERAQEIIEAAAKLGIKHLSLFVFSEENWKRPATEVSGIMRLMNIYLKKHLARLKKNNIQMHFVGNFTKLPSKNLAMMQESKEYLADCNGMQVTLALSYGARSEITEACKAIAEKVSSGELSIENITHNVLAEHMYAPEIPDPDLIIRTSGEQRLSNFYLWQAAYAEFYFTQTFWPDFSKEHFREAIVNFQQRQRRFGKVDTSVNQPRPDVRAEMEAPC